MEITKVMAELSPAEEWEGGLVGDLLMDGYDYK